MCLLEHDNEQVFSVLAQKLTEEGRQPRVNFFEVSEMYMDVFADGWQSSLNTLRKAAADVATSVGAVQAAFDVTQTPTLETQTGSRSRGIDGEHIQFDAEPESLEASLDPSSIFFCFASRWQMLESKV